MEQVIRNSPEDIVELNRLIGLAQNRNGTVPKQDREDAIIAIIGKFANLIRKIAKRVYRKSSGYTWEDWEMEATSIFFEMLVDDFLPKEDGGTAVFAYYVQSKLSMRLLYLSQSRIKHYSRELLTTMNDSVARNGTEDIMDDSLTRQVILSVFSNTDIDLIENAAIENIRSDELKEQCNQILRIAREVLDERELFIFDKYYLKGMLAKEIGPIIEPPISKSRVNQIAVTVKNKILNEVGKQFLGRKLA